jgi:hypothetical protein
LAAGRLKKHLKDVLIFDDRKVNCHALHSGACSGIFRCRSNVPAEHWMSLRHVSIPQSYRSEVHIAAINNKSSCQAG